MYYYVNGTVAEIDAGLAVIDCSGVGYACATTNYTLSQLKKGRTGQVVHLSECTRGRHGAVRLRRSE